jgi:hypothetical protein
MPHATPFVLAFGAAVTTAWVLVWRRRWSALVGLLAAHDGRRTPFPYFVSAQCRRREASLETAAAAIVGRAPCWSFPGSRRCGSASGLQDRGNRRDSPASATLLPPRGQFDSLRANVFRSPQGRGCAR